MIQYRKAALRDMREVAGVHILTQPEYFTSTLGAELLTAFYTEFLKEDRLFVIAVDGDNGKIVGFCMGNYYTSTAEKRWERNNKNKIIRKLFIKALQFNRLAISRILRRMRGLLTGAEPVRDTYFCHLLSLGVLPEYRGNHIASNLIDAFEKLCLENAPKNLEKTEKTCTIGAYKWNTAGCKLYEYKGYSVYEETRDKYKFIKKLGA